MRLPDSLRLEVENRPVHKASGAKIGRRRWRAAPQGQVLTGQERQRLGEWPPAVRPETCRKRRIA